MGNGFAETSVNKIDQKKYEENFNKIDWGKLKEDEKEESDEEEEE